MLEHPSITKANLTGYPNAVAQIECCGIDALGDEILVGDDVVVDGEELILQSNLEEYLTEVYGFQFKTAE